MREIRDFRKIKKYNKGRSRRPIYIIVTLSSVIILLAVFMVLRNRGGTESADLMPGTIYTGDRQQPQQKSSDNGNEDMAAESGKNDSAGTDDFTFYKVLKSREGEITPLNAEPPDNSDEKGMDDRKNVSDIHEEKMLQIDSEIVKKIENKSTDDIIYTVQIGALRQEKSADELVSNLRSRGFAPYITRDTNSGRSPLFKVRIGRFLSMIDAQEVAAVLKREGYATYVLKISGSE